MKRIVLERLTLRNFKGIKEFNVPADGRDVDIYGDNGTGKTTLFDGFLWLLFGKDSTNSATFEIKTLDSSGNVFQHKLEHEIEGSLLIDDRRRIFRRVYKEDWTKKRGAAIEEFTGHTTSYFIDGVPAKAGEYKAEVDSIIKEDLFRLLTSPSYFNEQLNKDQRRKKLLEVCGDLTDSEVIHGNKELEPLPTILAGRDMDSHKKVVSARLSSINKEIKELPVRISEVQRQMPDVSELDEGLLKDDITLLRSRIEAREAEVSRILSGGEVSVKEKRLREIETEQLEIKTRMQSAVLDKVAIKRDEVNRLHQEQDRYRRNGEDKQQRICQNERLAAGRRQEVDRLRAEFAALKNEVFENQHDENCPTCGQALPVEQIQAAHDKAEADFNRRIADRKERINADGKAAVAEAEKFEQEISRLQGEIDGLNDVLAVLQTEISAAEGELADLRAGVKDPAADPEYAGKQAESSRLQEEIRQLRDSSQTAAATVREEIGRLRREVEDMERDLVKFEGIRRAEQRIAELEKQERELAGEYERLQHELYLCEEFTKTKVSMLDAKINSKFHLARFRLFKTQVNGGMDEVCDTLYNGVPYDGGLNNAARINVGLDIINTLSAHYGFSAPIFVDNAEAVTQLIDTDAQVIRLVVSAPDKQLRLESKSIQEAI
ncbi:AAA domain-containing protein [Paenibacillus sophorae]|uniref:Nuclease SbcCD subunit C n=1 Tax=Paenibacillus sophorae TaxID=1333845 RepID=A0A1H8LBH9_9BACL|nr:AAA family ATPase [Paenibacillus sophorae]QWU17349.1 AAA family ATPase [Paenibacillus sophorae]SEO02477.1 AAA domain-containing protein [Paenibacillus sophorae]